MKIKTIIVVLALILLVACSQGTITNNLTENDIVITPDVNNQTTKPAEQEEILETEQTTTEKDVVIANKTETNKEPEPEILTVHFFWGDGCPACAYQKPYMEKLAKDYPEIKVESYEIYRDEGNRALFYEKIERYDVSRAAVPTTFIGEKYWIGFSEQRLDEMKQEIERQLGK